ncbi:MAG: glycosyltransferase family 39 protein [Proteobacteria bacterium]|nr:glycosyltransferase family 39 protein [Pseudomonadota bacterium]MBU1596348.1 glycosyltransferase family 39 protein [Pseudomonadota bacterium]
MNLSRPRNVIWLILGLALALRLVLFASAAGEPERFSMPDSGGYLLLARQAAAVYASSPEMSPDVSLSMDRPPLYPLFLRLAGMPAEGEVWPMILAQILCSVGTVWLVWALGRQSLGDGPAQWAALLLAADPASAVYANLLLTESMFTTGLALSFWQLSLALQGQSLRNSALGALALSLSTLTRPASLYLPVLLAPLLALGGRPRRFWWQGACLFLAVFTLFASLWIWRNRSICGEAMFTTMEPSNMNYRAIWAVAEQRGISFEAAEAAIEDMGLPRQPGRNIRQSFNNITSKASIQLLLDNPYGFAKSSLRGLGYYFLGPGQTGLAQLTRLEIGGPASLAASAATLAFLFAVYAGAAWGMVVLFRTGQRQSLMLLLAPIAYFTLLSAAPEAYVRFRIPAMPFFCLLAGSGLDASWTAFRRRHPNSRTAELGKPQAMP